MNNYSYNNFANPYMRNYQMPNYGQPQYVPQQQQQSVPPTQMQMQQPQQQPMQQPIQQPMQQPMQVEAPILYVGYTTLKEAEAYILMPNTKAIFIDKANGMVYEKVCKNDGQSFITAFKKYEPNAENPQEAAPVAPPIDTTQFVKKRDLADFVTVNEYNNLLDQFDALRAQITAFIQPPKAKTKAHTEPKKEIE